MRKKLYSIYVNEIFYTILEFNLQTKLKIKGLLMSEAISVSLYVSSLIPLLFWHLSCYLFHVQIHLPGFYFEIIFDKLRFFGPLMLEVFELDLHLFYLSSDFQQP